MSNRELTVDHQLIYHSDVTMDVYNHIADKQDIREEAERYARVAGN